MAPCASAVEIAAYRAALVALVRSTTGEEAKPLPPEPPAPWGDQTRPAQVVVDYAHALGVSPPAQADWAALSQLQRFVLIKLTRDNHDNVNFLPAMSEFGLWRRVSDLREASDQPQAA